MDKSSPLDDIELISLSKVGWLQYLRMKLQPWIWTEVAPGAFLLLRHNSRLESLKSGVTLDVLSDEERQRAFNLMAPILNKIEKDVLAHMRKRRRTTRKKRRDTKQRRWNWTRKDELRAKNKRKMERESWKRNRV